MRVVSVNNIVHTDFKARKLSFGEHLFLSPGSDPFPEGAQRVFKRRVLGGGGVVIHIVQAADGRVLRSDRRQDPWQQSWQVGAKEHFNLNLFK